MMVSIRSTQRGFTLIELLVVIAIIGLLSSVVLASLNSARAKGRDARRIADMRQIQTALELYYSDNGRYPTPPSSTSNCGSATSCVGGLTVLTSGDYISVLPTDPQKTDTSYNYRYYCNNPSVSNCQSYTMLTYVEKRPGWCRVDTLPGYSGWETPSYPPCTDYF